MMCFEEIILAAEWRRDRGMGYRARQNVEPRNWERAIRRLLHLPGKRGGWPGLGSGGRGREEGPAEALIMGRFDRTWWLIGEGRLDGGGEAPPLTGRIAYACIHTCKLRDLDCTVSGMPSSPILPFYPERQIYLLFGCRQDELGPVTMPNL